jgi:hypothetical protein
MPSRADSEPTESRPRRPVEVVMAGDVPTSVEPAVSAEEHRAAVEEARERVVTLAGSETPEPTVSATVDLSSIPDGEVVRIEDIQKEQQVRVKELAELSLIDKDPRVAQAVAGATIGVVTATTGVIALGYGGALATGAGAAFVGWKSLSAVDWFARRLDAWGDDMLDRKWILSPITNRIAKGMDWTAKKLGLDTTLADRLKKNKEDRKKLAEKYLKDFQASEKAHAKKITEEEKKAERRRVIEKQLGKDVAEAIGDELDELEKAEKKTEPVVEEKPATPAKAA